MRGTITVILVLSIFGSMIMTTIMFSQGTAEGFSFLIVAFIEIFILLAILNLMNRVDNLQNAVFKNSRLSGAIIENKLKINERVVDANTGKKLTVIDQKSGNEYVLEEEDGTVHHKNINELKK